MTITLTQQDPILGDREFELINNEVQYTIHSPLGTDSLSVILNVLDAKPVISDSTLSFVSKVNREPLIEFLLDKPDKETFDQFVDAVKDIILAEDFSLFRVKEEGLDVAVDVVRLGEAIDMLQKYVDSAEIDVFLSILMQLKASPDEVQYQHDAAEAFNELGFAQGQVLTYAPYINYLLSGSKDKNDLLG